ncbi:MAG: hypothetical protein PHY55_05580 [Bacteroidales bacterium]|nr:hypothetical protein [Bacteroidales bacterium]
MKKIILSLITAPFILLIIILSFSSCKNIDESGVSKVLVLKVDYLTNKFEGGTELTFTKSSPNFNIQPIYISPGDFGNISMIYQDINELLFDGSIIWMGKGYIKYPRNFIPANRFEIVLTSDYVIPKNGFENVFNPNNTNYDYSPIWSSVQSLVKVREYLRSNPNSTAKLFLYTPSVGAGNPEDWDWIIFLKN